MIIFDVETTGLITNEALPLAQQPRIIEIGAMKVNDDGEELARFEVLVNPGMKLPAGIPGITGITDEMLVTAKPFAAHWRNLANFFLGQTTFVAHNARFDLMMLVFELRRIDKQWQFPFCPNVLDTVSVFPGKLVEWGKKVRGADYVQQHRAIADVELLRECYFTEMRPGQKTETK